MQLGESLSSDRMVQETIETLHNLDNAVLHLLQRPYDDLLCRPHGINERYLRNELAVALEFLYEDRGHICKCIGFVEPLCEGERKLKCSARNDDSQFAVLVNDVQVMDSRQHEIHGIRSTIVGLELLDKIPNLGIPDSLYFSFVLGKYVRLRWTLLQEGKLNQPEVLPSVLRIREVPNDVIETRSEVVDNLAREDAKSRRNGSLSVILNCLQDNLLIVVDDDRVIAFLKKSCDLGLKVNDVLAGPI